jgi:hypothetical protein
MCRAGVLLSVLWLSSCGPANPGLERFEEREWIELGPVVVESVSGQRRGANVEATGVFRLGEDRMTLSMSFVLGPPARFVEGRHSSRIGGESVEGLLSAESVTFLGGQNTEPSVGGVFVFENPVDGARYRLRFPPTLIARPVAADRASLHALSGEGHTLHLTAGKECRLIGVMG